MSSSQRLKNPSAAARKSIKGLINVSVQINPKTGDIEVIAQKEVVDKVTIPEEEISLEEAQAAQSLLRNWPMGRYYRHSARFRTDRSANSTADHLAKTPKR